MKMTAIKGFTLFILVFAGLTIITNGQSNGSISGTVTIESNNSPLANVSVTLSQLRRTVQTDDTGNYTFTDVPAGIYTVVTHIEGFSDRVKTINLMAGAKAGGVDFAMSLTALREEVTVTTSGVEQSVFDSFQSVNSVGSTRLREQAATGLGDVLEREAGVGKRSYGPGTSRPIIRGFDGDRVLVTQDGVRLGSIGFQSGDHGEPVDTLSAERVEIVKGPATLLYGSSALGGVVNVISDDDNDAHRGLRGFFTGLGNTVNRQGGISGKLEYGFNKYLVSVSGSGIREGNYQSPLGRVPNSKSRSFDWAGTGGYYADKGFLVGNFIYAKRRYGVPYGGFIEANGFPAGTFNFLLDPGDEEIDLDMRRYNGRVRGGFRDRDSFITAGNFAFSYTDYQHQELEVEGSNETVGTTFTNKVTNYRGTFEQKPYKNLTGRFGFEGFNRKYQTVGAEQLINGQVNHNNFAFFGLEEIGLNKRVAVQLGGRVESNRYNPTNNVEYNDRSFTGFSGSAGLKIGLWTGSSFVTTFTSSYRAPGLEELYNNGAHPGNLTFEIGNQTLARERSNGIEFSFRQNYNRLRFDGSFFYYNINNFVFLAPEDDDNDGIIDVEDGLPVTRYLQADSRYYGADATVDYEFNKYVGAFFVADIVKAEIKNGGSPLPRITPPRVRIGMDFKYNGLSVRPEGVFVGKRSLSDIFPTEEVTDGYGLFNINSSYTLGREKTAHIFSVSGTNLTNKLYRNHLSFIKGLIPEPGRGLRGSYTFRFF